MITSEEALEITNRDTYTKELLQAVEKEIKSKAEAGYKRTTCTFSVDRPASVNIVLNVLSECGYEIIGNKDIKDKDRIKIEIIWENAQTNV